MEFLWVEIGCAKCDKRQPDVSLSQFLSQFTLPAAPPPTEPVSTSNRRSGPCLGLATLFLDKSTKKKKRLLSTYPQQISIVLSVMKQNQIKFKNLTEDQTIQIIDLNDYFDDAIPTITKPVTKKQFILSIIDDEDFDEVTDANQAFSMINQNDGGDSNKVYITVIDGVAKVIIA